ncbi:hypothetical protein AWR36_007665 [Microbulbifer flavimaris]|uniref:Phosphodiester glycosidase domain-containing protein n=1 Tax=Microbulbifer flavimaris TaxID=1781068 RepID=A0ABX4I0D2_9GAMM|nr:hypothetical protein AVO43_07640 [Microbulbifer sp. ZGT114]PCO05870.1 hypothetical protein AWR36_007665 [Microbulbifer flavimaris]
MAVIAFVVISALANNVAASDDKGGSDHPPLRVHKADGNSFFLSIPVEGSHLQIVPVLSDTARAMGEWAKIPAALAVVNGGFFSGDRALSFVAHRGQVLAENASSVNRGGTTYPVMRSAFWVDRSGQPKLGWIYHHPGESIPRQYRTPLPYSGSDDAPLTPPARANGRSLDLDWGIGGGPRLLKDGRPYLTFQEEIFWGSGLRLDDRRPRTAICITSKQHTLIYVTRSARLDELPDRLLQVGCVNAMNLDGGGSTALYVNGEKIFDQGRAVPAVLMLSKRSTGRKSTTER